jgi:hypothetical protein
MSQRDDEPPTRTLPDAVGLLLPTDVPKAWRDAVERAAQLLAPAWRTHRPGAADADLGTLALVVYTLAHERGQTADELSLDVVRTGIADRIDFSGEPIGVRVRVNAVLTTAGHTAAHDALSRLRFRLMDQGEPHDAMLDIDPGPSAMRYAVERIIRTLASTDREPLADHPVFEATGALRVEVPGRVLIVNTSAVLPIACPVCDVQSGSTVRVDGSDVTYECVDGHVSSPRFLELEAVRVRNAVARSGLVSGRVARDLVVAREGMDETWDPSRNRFLRADERYVDDLWPELDAKLAALLDRGPIPVDDLGQQADE